LLEKFVSWVSTYSTNHASLTRNPATDLQSERFKSA
jgi:hypothetical protein